MAIVVAVLPTEAGVGPRLLENGDRIEVSPGQLIRFPGLDPEALQVQRDGEDLIVFSPDGEAIRLAGFLADGAAPGGIVDDAGNLVASVLELLVAPAAGPESGGQGPLSDSASSFARGVAIADLLGHDFGSAGDRSGGAGADGDAPATAFAAEADPNLFAIAASAAPAAPGGPVTPTTPTLELAAASDSGVSDSDGITADTTPTLEGTAQPSATVEVFDGVISLGTVAADPNGAWAFTPLSALAEGLHVFTATEANAAGNLSAPSQPLAVTVDTTAPMAPTIDLAAASDSGVSDNDDITADDTPTLEGTAEPGATVEVFDGGFSLGTAVADPSGAWTFTPAQPLADGVYDLSATANDAAGNVSPPSSLLPVTIDAAGPTVLDVATSPRLVTDAIVGAGTFTVAVVFDAPMNQAVAPTLSFDPSVAGTLSFAGGAWTGPSTYEATYDVADADVILPDIAIDVEGAEGLAGSLQQDHTPQVEFGIDTVNPPLPPDAVDDPDAGRVLLSAPLQIAAAELLANDLDLDGTETIVAVSNVMDGIVTLDVATQTLIVQADPVLRAAPGIPREVTFDYTIEDTSGQQDTATATVTVVADPSLSELGMGTLGGLNGFRFLGEAAGDNAGRSVSEAGDVDGDGVDDFLVGAFQSDAGGSFAGAAYVIFGGQDLAAIDAADGTADGNLSLGNVGSTGTAGIGGFRLTGEAVGDFAARSVSAAGDVNGDGIADLIVGADRNIAGGLSAGAAYVVFGGQDFSAGDFSLADVGGSLDGFRLTGEASDLAGYAVSAAGDVDGDGVDDLIVGAVASPAAGPSAGAAYVVFGGQDFSAGDFSLANVGGSLDGFRLTGELGNDTAGYSVSAAGDVDGDGIGDLIVGAPNNASVGAAYVVFGGQDFSAGDFSLSDVGGALDGFRLTGEVASGRAGLSVSTAGDIDGDGIDDLIVGTYYNGGAVPQAGAAYVVFGGQDFSAGDFSLAEVGGALDGFRFAGEVAASQAGISVSAAGDVDGDGFDDLLVGDLLSGGRTFLLFGGQDFSAGDFSPADIDVTLSGFRLTGEGAGHGAGRSVSAAGDVNGDGIDDLLVGANGHDAAGTFAGAAYVIFGGDFSRAIQQQGGDGDDTLTGDAQANVLIGGLGNDSLVGNGGADVLYGGAGDDTLSIADDSFQRLDGGNGQDILALDGAFNLFLTGVPNTAVTGIEEIDLGNGAVNHLALDLEDVFDLTGTVNAEVGAPPASSLLIRGDSGLDRVSLAPLPPGHPSAAGAWLATASGVGPGGDFDRYEYQAGGETLATVLVEQGVAVDTLNPPLFTDLADSVDLNAQQPGSFLPGSQYDALDGDDVVTLPDAAAAQALPFDPALGFLAGAGSDRITGGDLGELIYGGADDDSLFGGAGSDTLVGGLGQDTVQGGFGTADTLFGDVVGDLDGATGGDDILSIGGNEGGVGYGDAGGDLVSGARGGDDELFGVFGDDVLVGDAGGSIDMTSAGGNDTIAGSSGDDLLYGDAVGADNGNGGDDRVFGSSAGSLGQGGVLVDADTIYGGSGDDELSGEVGANITGLSGGLTVGSDTIFGGSGDDTVFGDAGNNFFGTTVVAGSDTLFGGDGADSLYGDAGRDFSTTVLTQAGNDSLFGGNGDDILYGDQGGTASGTVTGGDDFLDGGAGDDSLFGGTGSDTLAGGAGNDLLDGGEGNDIIDLRDGGIDTVAIADRAHGVDRIEGFQATGAGHDVLDLDSLFDDLELDLNLGAGGLDAAARAARVVLMENGSDTEVFVDQSAGGDGSNTVMVAEIIDVLPVDFQIGDSDAADILVTA